MQLLQSCPTSSGAMHILCVSAWYIEEILPYMQCWNNLSKAKITKNARILLHASLNHDVVTASQLLNASMILSTPLCDHYGPVSSTAALEIGGRGHRCTPIYCTRHDYRVALCWRVIHCVLLLHLLRGRCSV